MKINDSQSQEGHDHDGPNTYSRSVWGSYLELTRLHKSVMGNTLMLWPCVWGLTMAAYRFDLSPGTLFVQKFVFALGSTLLHSAACVFNDICDIEFDKQVDRTKNRPLPAGRVSILGAWSLVIILLVPYSALLLLADTSIGLLGLIGVVPLHAFYPLMKRWTYWPQAWLGLAMNWGLILAWVFTVGRRHWEVVWILYAGSICWTVVYDTIYACQDRQDDLKAGVKSTAVLFGDWVRFILASFATVFMACVICAGFLNHQGVPYFVISCGGGGLHLLWQLMSWRVGTMSDDGAKFNSNGLLGFILYIGMLADYHLKVVVH